MSTGPIIDAKNIVKSFGSKQILQRLNITVNHGEFLAISGLSGAGKTTLLRSLAAITSLDSGEIIYEGERIDNLSDSKRSRLRRKQFGFVFQSNQLLPELSALDNVALPLLINRLKKKAAYFEAKKWLDKVGLSSVSNKLPSELSGGQVQRISVARALITRPNILFLDEPTGSLDSMNTARVMELITEAKERYATTIVMVTHEQKISAYADRSVFLRDGRVQEDDR